MAEKIQIALVYIRNGKETIFPVRDIDQAVQLADAIADSDLLTILWIIICSMCASIITGRLETPGKMKMGKILMNIGTFVGRRQHHENVSSVCL